MLPARITVSLTKPDLKAVDAYRDAAKSLTDKRPTRETAIVAMMRQAAKDTPRTPPRTFVEMRKRMTELEERVAKLESEVTQ